MFKFLINLKKESNKINQILAPTFYKSDIDKENEVKKGQKENKNCGINAIFRMPKMKLIQIKK